MVTPSIVSLFVEIDDRYYILPGRNDWRYTPIVKWNDLVHNISWDAILILGAGLALATAFQVEI